MIKIDSIKRFFFLLMTEEWLNLIYFLITLCLASFFIFNTLAKLLSKKTNKRYINDLTDMVTNEDKGE